MERVDGIKDRLAETFERVWSHALLAVSTAEDEAHRIAHRVAGAAGWSQEELKRQVRELTECLMAQRRELERSVDEGARRALGRLAVPRREELQAFQERLEKVAQRIDALASKR